MYKPLEDYIATLTDEEKIQYKAIIEECLQRDRQIEENMVIAKKNLERFSIFMQNIINTKVTLRNLIDEIRENTLTLYMHSIPHNKFYNA